MKPVDLWTSAIAAKYVRIVLGAFPSLQSASQKHLTRQGEAGRNCCLPSLRCRQKLTKRCQLLRYLALERVVLARSIVAIDAFPKAANKYEVAPCLEQVSAVLPLPCLPVTERYDPLPHSSYPECILFESKCCVTYTRQRALE